jgi:hypothetical protein
MTNYSSTVHRDTTGASIEVATINFNGRDFTNLGSVIDEKRGIIYGYPTQAANYASTGGYVLTTWDGQIIASCHKVNSWLNRNTFGGFPVRMYAWSCLYNGRKYAGRNAGPELLLRMNRTS